MAFKGAFLAVAVLALFLGKATAVKDDAFVAYLNGTNLATLGVTTLNGVAVKQSATATGFFTLTDFGKNVTSWTLDPSTPLANPASLNLFYYTPGTANPPQIFQLTTDFSDFTPFGEFTTAQLNTALAAINVPPVSGPTPLITLVKGGNLLAAWISKDGSATVGIVTDDPNVGPPPSDIDDITYLAQIDSGTVVYGKKSVFGANATLDILDNLDGTYSYNFFTDLAVGPSNLTLYYPESLKLAAVSVVGSTVFATTVYRFPFTGVQWLQAAGEIGLTGELDLNAILKGIKKAKISGSSVTLYAALGVSNIEASFTNYGPFIEDFIIDIPEEETPASPSPSPAKRRPPPPPKKRPSPPPKKNLRKSFM